MFDFGDLYQIPGDQYDVNIIETIRFNAFGYVEYKRISGDVVDDVGTFNPNSAFAHSLIPLKQYGNDEITIVRDGDNVTATRYIAGREVSTVTEPCHFDSEFDLGTAPKRALKKLYKVENLITSDLKFDWIGFLESEYVAFVKPYNLRSFVELAKIYGCKWVHDDDPYNFIDQVACVSTKKHAKIYLFVSKQSKELSFRYDNTLGYDFNHIIEWKPSPEDDEILKTFRPVHFDWHGFMNGLFAIKCRWDDVDSFLNTAESKNITWATGETATDFDPIKEAIKLYDYGVGYSAVYITYSTGAKAGMMWEAEDAEHDKKLANHAIDWCDYAEYASFQGKLYDIQESVYNKLNGDTTNES